MQRSVCGEKERSLFLVGHRYVPPPKFPQPPTKALAVPTTLLVNIRLVQYWHMTKVPPAIPMNNRRTASPMALLTRPVQAVGTEASVKIMALCAETQGVSKGQVDTTQAHEGHLQ